MADQESPDVQTTQASPATADAPEPTNAYEADLAAADISDADPNLDESSAHAGTGPVEDVATPPVSSRHPTILMELAEHYGVSQAEIDSQSTEQLSLLVNRMQLIERRAEDRARSASPVVSPPQAEPPEEVLDLGINEADFDEGLVTALRKVASAPIKRVKELEARLATFEQAQQAQQADSFTNQIDNTFAALGKGYQKIFGKTALNELKDAPEAQRRHAVWNEAKRQAGDKATLAQVLAKIPAVAKSLFGEQTPEPDPHEPSGDSNGYEPSADEKKRRWDASLLSKPTQRAGSVDPPGPTKAAKVVAAKMRAKGFDCSVHDDDLESELPK